MTSYYTANLPGTGGAIKTIPEDFIVEEIPAYPPSGEGQHLFLTVEKRGITTQEMVRRVARALEINPSDIGVAGQKDRMAVARQVISIPFLDPVRAANLKLEGVEVTSASRHGNKLRTGHLRGNNFIITIRDVGPEAATTARAVLDSLITSWVPNRFGAQRFGMRGDNAVQGRALILGELQVHDRFRRRMLVSAYQSHLFNKYLGGRVDEGLLHRVIEGEILQRPQTGGLFACMPDDMAYSQSRLEMRTIVPTGPMFGHSMFLPLANSAAARREEALLASEEMTLEKFIPMGRIAEGTRRALLVRIEGTSVRASDEGIVVSFALPSGSYATVVLEEIMKPEQPLQVAADTD